MSHAAQGNSHIRRFAVRDDGTLAGGEVFVTTAGIPDGLRLDSEGNVWTSAGPKIDIYSPEAELLGQIGGFAADVTNLTFGGAGRNRLFVTAGTGLYGLPILAWGAQWP